MYTVTFYSFKGGVGRTMALMNTAAHLASLGRRVLVVDFDLEAPGAGTFELFSSAASVPGVVEFVSSYLERHETPDVKEYVHSVSCKGGGELLFMPAGVQNDSYGKRLSEIDWGELYESHNGYLLLEDLKAQWKQAFSPDYVLIDSRTGHTDVAGICTRQLPDAVAVLFFPNEQNLAGLKKIVGDIESEEGRSIELHFVPSNVPDLDDEDRILAGRLSKFRKALGFESPATVIHHNNSLALLNQVLYVDQRPNSSLANEYRQLSKAIQEKNPEDVNGAALFLEKLYAEAVRGDKGTSSKKIDARLNEIFGRHPTNERVLDGLLRVWLHKGDLQRVLEILDLLIDRIGSEKSEYRFRRAMFRLDDATRDSVLDDARAGLQMQADYFDLRYFLNFVRRSREPTLYAELLASSAFAGVEVEEQLELITQLTSKKDAQSLVVDAVTTLYADHDRFKQEDRRALLDLYARCLIANGRFSEACLIYEEQLDADGLEQNESYNYAVARWAIDGRVEQEIFENVLDFKFEAFDANTYQCLSLAAHILGRKELALSYIGKSNQHLMYEPSDVYSGWRYCAVSVAEFRQDLDAQLKMINGENIAPAFIRGRSLSLSLA